MNICKALRKETCTKSTSRLFRIVKIRCWFWRVCSYLVRYFWYMCFVISTSSLTFISPVLLLTNTFTPMSVPFYQFLRLYICLWKVDTACIFQVDTGVRSCGRLLAYPSLLTLAYLCLPLLANTLCSASCPSAPSLTWTYYLLTIPSCNFEYSSFSNSNPHSHSRSSPFN